MFPQTYGAMMILNNQDRLKGGNAQACHPERSEGSPCPAIQILRCAQDDIADLVRESS